MKPKDGSCSKSLSRLTKKKREKTYITKIRNKTANLTKIKRIINKYYKQLFAKKLDSVYQHLTCNNGMPKEGSSDRRERTPE